MQNHQLLAVFRNQYELASVKTQLESEGITCQVKDALALQVNGILSDANNIRLFVKVTDLVKARLLLNGNLSLVSENNSNDIIEMVDESTSSILLLNLLRPELRMIVLAAIVFGILVFTAVYLIPVFQ